jgi:hypothetical protein
MSKIKVTKHGIEHTDESFSKLVDKSFDFLNSLVNVDERKRVLYEMHADGVKEVPCDFCEVSCNNDHCVTKDNE